MSRIKLIAPWGEINPYESNEIGFKSTFGTEWNVMQLSIDSVTLANEDRERILHWIYNEQGRFEGIPINLQSDTVNSNYYLDLNTCQFTDKEVSVSIKPYKGADYFWQQAESITFESIEKFYGTLSPNTIKIPYIIQKPDIAMQTLIISLTTFSLVTEIARTIKAIADLAGQALDVVGTGVLTTVAQTIALALYLISMIVALIQLIQQIVAIFFPKLRYFKAMRDYDLIRLACERIGFTLDSNILNQLKDNLVTLPIPITREADRKSFFEFISNELSNDIFNYGYPTASDTTPTVADFIRSFMQIYNCNAIAYNGVFKMETKSWFQQNTNTSLELYFNEQDKRELAWKFDTEEDWKRKNLSWLSDPQDLHTMNNFFRLSIEKSSEPISVIDPYLFSIQGYEDTGSFRFATAERKNGLNAVEKLVKGLLNVADTLMGIFGGNQNFASLVQNRVGVLVISEETFSLTKKMWCEIVNGEGKQPANFKDFIGAKTIYDAYHAIDEIPVNSGRIFENMPLPLTEYEFAQIAQNKFVNLNGQVVELLQSDFQYKNAIGNVTYKEYDGSGFNVKTLTVYE